MNVKNKHLLSITFLVCVVTAICFHVQGQDAAQDGHSGATGVRPKVIASHENGTRYEAVVLSNASFQFFERQQELHCNSRLLDFELNQKGKDKLDSFKMILRSEPTLFERPPPGSPTWIPATKYTVYNDLDGDSVLDTMTKIGPNLKETYILYGNAWVQIVGHAQFGWKRLKSVQALKTKKTYTFDKDGWKLSGE